MQSNVLDYEPELALFVPEDNPLLFYDKIIQFAETNLENSFNLFKILDFISNTALFVKVNAIILRYTFGFELDKSVLKKLRTSL